MYATAVTKRTHVLLTHLLSLYLTFVFLCKGLMKIFFEYSAAEAPQPILFYIFVLVFIYAVFYMLLHKLASFKQALFHHKQLKAKLSRPLFFSVFFIVMIFYLAHLATCYPGGFSGDTYMQWSQAHSMQFDDHHPFFHTLFFVLLTKIWDNYTFMLIVQIAAFASGLAYLAATMHSWGFRISTVLILCSIIALASPTQNIVMYFWKDTALSIFVLFFLSHIINIVLSNGVWLKEKKHWIGTSVLLACMTLVRHNAILLTAPMLILMLISLRNVRQLCTKIIVLVLALVIGFKLPVYQLFHVNPSNDSYLEATGLPMTILFSAYEYAPEILSEEAYSFLESLEPRESAVEKYVIGNYNLIKWSWGNDYAALEKKFDQMPVADFIKITLETIRSYSSLAIQSVLELTEMVWDPIDPHYQITAHPNGTPPSFIPIPEAVEKYCSLFFNILDNILSGAIFQKMTDQLGVLILIMLLSCYVSIHQFRGITSLWYILPVMCYNFGTMLLLCGEDYRFFHFNCIIAYPLMILLLSKPHENQNTCKS